MVFVLGSLHKIVVAISNGYIFYDITGMQYLEIISRRFGYRPKYQPETPLSAREL